MEQSTTEARWAERVAGWRASGQSAREYAETQGSFTAGGLRHWAYRLKKAGVEAARPPVRLVRIEPVSPAPTVAGGAGALVIELGAARIHVPPGYDPATLRAVVDALAAEGRR
jgi:hypothetical protein